ncbi:unnamed protein product [Psylliodes chrysocephalus]|uniref:Peptidase S1 domain-containing protein n=1 Tax=Psylliodes chrysocephalus TaxID=3402493 RepID=A0A9P0GAK6_9CUCU|nr:unnamed protein product [Psylliodes chrysocephala]
MEKILCWTFILIAGLCLFVSANEEVIINELFETKLAKEVNVPFQVSLYTNYNDEFLCGGTIVSSNKVLTVAHCLYYGWGGIMPPIILTVKAGRTNLFSATSRNYDVTKVTFHKNFDSSSMDYNLAMIQVSTNFITDDADVREISLAKDSAVSSNCMVAGWNQKTGALDEAMFTMRSCDVTGKVCAGNANASNTSCEFSLGSSLVCDENLIGILSFKPECISNDPWIFENARDAFDMLGIEDNSTSSVSVVQNVKYQGLFNILIVLFSFLLIIMS